LTVYAVEPDFFVEDECGLLEEIGMNLSFALQSLEKEQQRKRAEEAVRESEERFQVTHPYRADGYSLACT